MRSNAKGGMRVEAEVKMQLWRKIVMGDSFKVVPL